jgi:hypothetical protein
VRAFALLFLCACTTSPSLPTAAPVIPDATPVPAVVPAEPATPPPPVDRRKLQLTLRSTPPGAIVAVDGRHLGITPLSLQLPDDGALHEFAFVLAGHAPWKVRFAPIQDGVIHGHLKPFQPAATP